MWTVPRVLVRRTASPAHADFCGLSSLATLIVIQLDVVPLPPRSQGLLWRVVCWADILLDVIGCGRERVLFIGTQFSNLYKRIFHRATNAAGKSVRITVILTHEADVTLGTYLFYGIVS